MLLSQVGQMQIVQSPTFRGPMREGAFKPPGSRGNPSTGMGSYSFSSTALASGSKWKTSGGGGGGGGGAQQRSQSAGSLEVSEVRALCGDEPSKGEADMPRSPHEGLLTRLKSRAARQEAEQNRAFIAEYRKCNVNNPTSEARLDALLKNTSKKAGDLKQRSEDLQQEAADAERRLEKTNALNVGRATETELQAMSAFERSQKRIQEDKREEDLQRHRDEVQANYAKVHRRLQSELIELRDFKVLLREFRRVRLEKLHDTLGRVCDGRQLRACVREMIRHGAQRILQKLESAQLPLEPWMREVLVNCCHVEIRIEDAEEKLLAHRRHALQPVKDDVQAMLAQTKTERFEKLCTRTWENRLLSTADSAHPRRHSDLNGGDPSATNGEGHAALESAGGQGNNKRAVPEKVAGDMRAAEGDIAALRRLLSDMRHNAGAVICNKIRQAEKNGGREACEDATEWGKSMLAMFVSEDFAKAMMKELQKSAPHAKLTT